MIGSCFLSSSSWSPDLALSKEFLPSLDSFVFDVEIEQNAHSIDSNRAKWEVQCSSYSNSPVHSSTSEECDWSFLGEDIRNILPVTDSLTSKWLEEEESIMDSLNLDDLDWLSLTNTCPEQSSATDSSNETAPSLTATPKKKRKRTSSGRVSKPKSWSKMNGKERLRIACALSEIISLKAGLREQIAIIKMIDPSAVLSPTATEFGINLSHLDDKKLVRICEYLQKNTTCLLDFNSLMSGQFSKVKSTNASSAHKARRKQKKFSSPPVVDPELTHIKEREKKELKQNKKEKRSGLFTKEKVIKKLSNPQEEDEDVNILE